MDDCVGPGWCIEDECEEGFTKQTVYLGKYQYTHDNPDQVVPPSEFNPRTSSRKQNTFIITKTENVCVPSQVITECPSGKTFDRLLLYCSDKPVAVRNDEQDSYLPNTSSCESIKVPLDALPGAGWKHSLESGDFNKVDSCSRPGMDLIIFDGKNFITDGQLRCEDGQLPLVRCIQRRSCENVNPPANGRPTEGWKSTLTSGDSNTFTCNDGYDPSNNGQLTCDYGDTEGRCLARCSNVALPTRGKRTATWKDTLKSGEWNWNDSFECEDGYMPIGARLCDDGTLKTSYTNKYGNIYTINMPSCIEKR